MTVREETNTSCSSSSVPTREHASTRDRSCINGEHVEAGEVIADGPSTDNGEVASG